MAARLAKSASTEIVGSLIGEDGHFYCDETREKTTSPRLSAILGPEWRTTVARGWGVSPRLLIGDGMEGHIVYDVDLVDYH